jgi:hypothetical protein
MYEYVATRRKSTNGITENVLPAVKCTLVSATPWHCYRRQLKVRLRYIVVGGCAKPSADKPARDGGV